MSGKRRSTDTGDGSGCLVLAMICLVAMPFVGLYLISTAGNDSGKRTIGLVLLVIGVLLWGYVALNN